MQYIAGVKALTINHWVRCDHVKLRAATLSLTNVVVGNLVRIQVTNYCMYLIKASVKGRKKKEPAAPKATKAAKQTKLTSFKPRKKSFSANSSDDDDKAAAESAASDDEVDVAPREKAPTRRAGEA